MSDRSTYDFDLAVIGGGSGGYAAARTGVAEGLKTVVIEGAQEIGGLCILRGCMPTKALLYAAEVMHLASHSQPWGIKAEDVSFHFSHVMARKDRLIKEFADYRQQQLLSGKFQFLRATARFADAHTLELSPVSGSGSLNLIGRGVAGAGIGKREGTPKTERLHKLTARNFIMATGSTLAPSP